MMILNLLSSIKQDISNTSCKSSLSSLRSGSLKDESAKVQILPNCFGMSNMCPVVEKKFLLQFTRIFLNFSYILVILISEGTTAESGVARYLQIFMNYMVHSYKNLEFFIAPTRRSVTHYLFP